jgi:hypothetical protein
MCRAHLVRFSFLHRLHSEGGINSGWLVYFRREALSLAKKGTIKREPCFCNYDTAVTLFCFCSTATIVRNVLPVE